MAVLMIIHFLICAFLVFVILLQPGKGDAGVGFGSSSQSIFGSRGAGNFLTKVTSVCALCFLLTSFVLTRSRMKEYTSSVIKDDEKAAPGAKPNEPSQAKPTEVPKSGEAKGEKK